MPSGPQPPFFESVRSEYDAADASMDFWKLRLVSGLPVTRLTTFWIAAEAHHLSVACDTNFLVPPRSSLSGAARADGDGEGDAPGLAGPADPEGAGDCPPLGSGEATYVVGGGVGAGLPDGRADALEYAAALALALDASFAPTPTSANRPIVGIAATAIRTSPAIAAARRATAEGCLRTRGPLVLFRGAVPATRGRARAGRSLDDHPDEQVPDNATVEPPKMGAASRTVARSRSGGRPRYDPPMHERAADAAAPDHAAPAVGSVLDLEGVVVRRGTARLLDRVSLRVRAGERWVVVGPNGAGKSTLLALAATTLFPTSGRIRVLGTEIGRVDARSLRARIGLASAALAERFDPGLTAHDVVVTARTGALAPWWDAFSDADHERADALCDRLGIGTLAGRAFGTLSTGERQRVLLARTVLPDPDLLLVDEPAAGLDLRAREELVDALGALAHASRPAGTVLVTHHLEEIPPGFGHALVLARGRAVAGGRIEAVLTDAVLSEAYGIPLRVDSRDARWSARRA
jgi:iron complex transport system ATP-binding protein